MFAKTSLACVRIIATMVLLGSAARAQNLPPLVQFTKAQYPVLVKLRDDVYVIQNQNTVISEVLALGGNSTVLLTDDGVLLVDTKTDTVHDDLVAKVKSLTPKPIKYAVLTHNHPDHSGGADKLKAMGVVIIESEADRGNAMRGAPPFKSLPDITYSGQDWIHLGGKDAVLTEYRGHTRGDTTVFLPAQRILVAGDLVTNAAGTPPLVSYADGGTWTDWVNALDEMAKVDFDTMVPGHGPTLTKAEFLLFRDRAKAMKERFRELNRARKTTDEIIAAFRTEFGVDYADGLTRSQFAGMAQELR